MTDSQARRRSGLSLIEVLIVIAVVGLLFQMVLPGVHRARESSRNLQCQNNLRQIGVASLAHEELLQHYPSGGWTWTWVGDPDRGSGKNQPGGWIYNLLPMLEQHALHDLGLGVNEAEKRRLAVQLQESVPTGFNCPSRRTPAAFAHVREHYLANSDPVRIQARSDYAANAGDIWIDVGMGPSTLAEGDSRSFPWPSTNKATGICFLRSAVRPHQITDGTSNTYLAGEKYLNPDNYTSGTDLGDDHSMYQGHDPDVLRWTMIRLVAEIGEPTDPSYWSIDEPTAPRRDGRWRSASFSFGSSHPAGWNAVMCDGSVHNLSYDIDPSVHRRMGNRRDDQLVRLSTN